MTSTVVQPGTYGLDAASFHAVTNFGPVRDAGAQWVSFYIGGTYGVSARNIEAAWAAGLPVMPNFERDAKAGLGGYTTGQLHATTAITQLTALGFEGECPVVFSGVDFGPTAGQFAALDAYHHALVDTLEPHGWTGGAYGPRSYLTHLDGVAWWPDDWPLWHWGGDGFVAYQWAWCKQWYGYDQTPIRSSTLGYAVDENTLFRPMKFWSGYGVDKDETPVPVEDDVTDEDMKTIAKYVWEYLIHNDQDQTDQTAEAMFGWAHLESYNGSFDRTAVNLTNQEEQTLADLIRFGHYEAHTANVKCDQILNVLTTLPSGGVTADAIVDELVRRLSQHT